MPQFFRIMQWFSLSVMMIELTVVYRNMKTRAHMLLFVQCLSLMTAALGYLMSLYTTTEDACFLMNQLGWIGKTIGIVSSLCLIRALSRFKIPKLLTRALIALSLITGLVIITTKKTALFYTFYSLTREGDWLIVDFGRGIWYYVWDLTVLTYLISSIAMIVGSIIKEKEHNRKMQYILIGASLVTEILVGLLTLLPISRYYDFNQIGYTIVSLLFLIALFKYKLMSIEETTKEYIIDELSAGVVALDQEGNVAYYNKTAPVVFPEITSDPHAVTEKIKDSIRSGEPVTVNDKIYTFEEKELDDSENAGKVYVLTDSTKHYYYLEELEEQKKLAENANKAKSEFLARMSHEIRTPLNTVLGMDEMILRDCTDITVKDYAMDIRRAGHTLLSLINDILDLSKIESGKMEITPVEYDVTGMLYDITNIVSAKTTNKNLVFDVKIDSDIPARLFGDDIRIRQVLANLLSNAVKYTQKGTISFRATKVPGQGDDGTAVIRYEVEDTGMGIKEEDMERLFAAFERIDETHNRGIEGTGLGMAISVKLLEMMDSKLNVKSEFGKGSLFWFDIRQKTVGAEPLGDFESRIIKYISDQYVYTNSFTAPDAHILVVDDNDMNRKVLVSLLKPTKIKVTEASGGAEAVELALKNHYDIIFTDHMMPGIDGVETLKMIRAEKGGPCEDTPIFVLTANAISGAKEMYMKEGFSGFLTKPVMSDRLERAIRETLPPQLIKPGTGRLGENSDLHAAHGELPMIFGLDWEVAMMRIQDKDVLMSILREFRSSVDAQADKLDELKERLPDSLDDYRIQAHGMKGAAGTAGILTLFGMAAVLEKAATAGNLETIDKIHGVFIREWRAFKEMLADLFETGEASSEEKPVIDDEFLRVRLELLTSYMNDMDMDGADETIGKLSAFMLPERVEAVFEDLKTAVAQIDWDRVGEILEKIRS